MPTTPGAVAESVARLRFATDAQSSPEGAAVDGEVEDHKVVFSDDAEALSGELYRIAEGLPEFKKMVDAVVNGGYACLPEDMFD